MVTIRLTLRKAEGCKCKLADGNPCCQLFSASMYKSFRDECHALTRDELDLVVMGQLQALVHNDRMTQKTKARNTERVHTSTQFLFGGHRVCTNMFCFLHTMSRKRLRCIKARWMENGLGPRNRVQHLPHNTTPLSEIQQFVSLFCGMQRKMQFCCLDAFQAINVTTFSFFPPRAQSVMYVIYITALPWSRKEPVRCVTPSFAGCGGSSLHRLL